MPSCALCSFGATSDKFLKEHMMMKHDEREFSCEICDSTIRGKQKMQMHKKSHVEVGRQCLNIFGIQSVSLIKYTIGSSHVGCITASLNFVEFIIIENISCVFSTFLLLANYKCKSCNVLTLPL